LNGPARNTVSTDSEELHHRSIAWRQIRNGYNVLLRHRDDCTHAAIRMNAENCEILATVWLSPTTRTTTTTTEIRVDRNEISARDSARYRSLSTRTVQGRLQSLYAKLGLSAADAHNDAIGDDINRRCRAVALALYLRIINTKVIELSERELMEKRNARD
jgi:hypothetical protein